VGPGDSSLLGGGSEVMGPGGGDGHGARSTRAAAACAMDQRSSRGSQLPR
jgi:hypothetical protein